MSATRTTRRFGHGLLAGTALFAAGACGPQDPTGTGGTGAGGGSAAPAWQVVTDGSALGGVVLSVWGTGPDDVLTVGGPLGNTGGSAVARHFDGTTWKDLAPGGPDSFWWVSGTSATDVWMVGEKGRMTHWDGVALTEFPRVTTATIWGLWAASPTDAWASAGTPGKGTAAENDVILHWDGEAWSKVPLPGAPLGRSLNKIWGTSSDNLYAVGEFATVWHKKGASWVLESDPPVAKSTLLTVFGCSASDVYAVGGGDVIHSDGKTWSKVSVSLSNVVNGVTCGKPGEVLLVGFGGLKQRLVEGAWVDEFDKDPTGDLHGSWNDGHGAFWAAGGDFVSKPAAGKVRRGILARWGSGAVNQLTP
ncbi:MAG: hypothetical protein ABI193_06360 [Minicystis sp.]